VTQSRRIQWAGRIIYMVEMRTKLLLGKYVRDLVIDVGTDRRRGARGSVVVKVLCYKPEGRGFETR
jgi:hypothetical protein